MLGMLSNADITNAEPLPVKLKKGKHWIKDKRNRKIRNAERDNKN